MSDGRDRLADRIGVIRDEMADPETRIYSDEMVRKFQEVSYHLNWHCANLDGR